ELAGIPVDGEGFLEGTTVSVLSGTAGGFTGPGQLDLRTRSSSSQPAAALRAPLGPLWQYFRQGGEPLWERALAAEAVTYDPAALQAAQRPPQQVSTGVSYSSATTGPGGVAPSISGGSLSNRTSAPGALAVDHPIGLAPHETTVGGFPTLRWLAFPGAGQYVVLVSQDHFRTLSWTARVTGTSAAPGRIPALRPGACSWRVVALDGAGRVLGRGSETTFQIRQ
ncbi:MAG: hypothetical protein AB1758_22590, partial [Candidatus Eremiobacterota bacterium]